MKCERCRYQYFCYLAGTLIEASNKSILNDVFCNEFKDSKEAEG